MSIITIDDAFETDPDLEVTVAELDFDDLVASAERVLHEEDNEPNIDIKPAVRSFRGKRDAEEEHEEGTPVKKGKEETTASLVDRCRSLLRFTWPTWDYVGLREFLQKSDPSEFTGMFRRWTIYNEDECPEAVAATATVYKFLKKATTLEDFEIVWNMTGRNYEKFWLVVSFQTSNALVRLFIAKNRGVFFADEHDPELGKWLERMCSDPETEMHHVVPRGFKVGADIFKALPVNVKRFLRRRDVVITEAEMPFKPAKRQ